MQFTTETRRVERTIGQKDGPNFTVQVPQPYVAGAHELTEGEANALNQTIAENLSNNLRAKLVEGKTVGEGDNAKKVQYTEAEAQKLVDDYLADYEIGVRRAGDGTARVTDPVEREARKIARAKAVALIKENGGKPADFDLGPLVDTIFEKNKDVLMAEGKKIVKALEKAREQSDNISLDGVDLSAAAKSAAAEGEGEGEGAAEEEAAAA
jgi:hypothetical protein